MQKHGGKGWLVIDQHCWDQCNQQCLDAMQNEGGVLKPIAHACAGGTGEDALQPDQIMQGLANLHKNRKAADSLPELAEVCCVCAALSCFSCVGCLQGGLQHR